MQGVTINIPSDRLSKLKEVSERLGISIEDLVLMSIEELLKHSEPSFQTAAEYVLNKNAELYQRLA